MKKILLVLLVFILGAVVGLDLFKVSRENPVRQVVQVFSKPTPLPTTAFSLENAPPDSLRGNITSLDGEVFRLSRTATQPAHLSPLALIQQGENIESSDSGKLALKFGNDSRLTIFSKTAVEVIQTLPGNLVFRQTRGKTVYENSGDGSLAILSFELLVNTQGATVQITNEEKNPVIDVLVTEGSATAAFNDTGFVSQVFNIKKNQLLIFDRNTKTAKVISP